MEINPHRYQKMIYRRAGTSGLKLPVLSLGLWYNFGEVNDYEICKNIIIEAFNHGITHFDLANNYGPPPGSAERTLGKILQDGLMAYRDELIISTKAGYYYWEGPYGDGGSRKYLFASLDRSLKHLGLSYVDIFYHHRYDAETDLKETMVTLRDIVLSGKAIYVGLSNYTSAQLKKAYQYLDEMNVPYVITQPSYSMLNRKIETDRLLDTQYDLLHRGTIAYSALAQGRLSNKYIDDIPMDSRAKNRNLPFLKESNITPELIEKLKKLDVIAKNRGQTIAQMALAWTIRDPRMTSTLIGVRTLEQLYENLETLKHLDFSDEEKSAIDEALNS